MAASLQRTMKSLILGACAAVVAGASASLGAAPPIRANYEIVLENGGGRWAAQSSAAVVPGQPIEHELGKYRLALTPVIRPSGEYTLEVAVGPLPDAPDTIHVPSTESFQGMLGYPLEFESVRGDAKVSGAIMMGRVGS